jgi:hypothetical protein
MASTEAPIPARVRWDRDSIRPTSIAWDGTQLAVTNLRAVRDERHAYPSALGPRLTLDLETTRGRAVLRWDARERRWYLDAIDEERPAA